MTTVVYTCDRCGYFTLVTAEHHVHRLCSRTNCGGTERPQVVAAQNPAAQPQPMPAKTDGVAIPDLVVMDIKARKAFGLNKYGTVLQAHNGRDALMDAYQEALDLAIYLRQVIAERDGK